MSHSGPQCIKCGKPLSAQDRIEAKVVCQDCRVALNGKLIDLDVAIRSNQDNLKRIREWPVIRHWLRKRFGPDRNVEELWEQFTDWLRSEHRTMADDYSSVPLIQILEPLAKLASPSICTKSSPEYDFPVNSPTLEAERRAGQAIARMPLSNPATMNQFHPSHLSLGAL